MAEAFFDLSPDDQRAVLRVEEGGAPAPFILEKDIWVVWTLGALFTSPVERPSGAWVVSPFHSRSCPASRQRR